MDIDVTLPGVAAGNAADTAAGGILKHQDTEFRRQMEREEHELLKRRQSMYEQAQAEEQAFRRRQLERIEQNAAGETAAYEQYLKVRGAQFQPKPGVMSGHDGFFGRSDASTSGRDEGTQLEEFLAGQRRNVLDYAAGMDPDAKRAFYAKHLPLLEEDEMEEREGVAARGAKRRLSEVLNSGFLDEEESAVAQQGLQGLMAGIEDSRSINAMLDALVPPAKERFKRQQNFQFGMSWAQQQIAEAAQGGVDVKGLHDALGDWIGSKDLDPKKLQAAILEKRYGLKLETFKIGKSEVPKNATIGQWRAVASAEADREVTDILSKDPYIAARLKEGGKNALGAAEYLEIRNGLKTALMRGYGAQAGLDEATLAALGYGEKAPESMKKDAEADVRARLKAAGIDPDLDVSPNTPEKKFDKAIQGTPAGKRAQEQRGRDANDDGVYDEEDIEVMQGAAGG